MKYALKLGASALAIGIVASATFAGGHDAFWKKAAEPYKGTTIRGVTESSPPSMFIREVLAPEFEALTGIRVDIETTSWDQMYDKGIKDMEAGSGIYDMVYIEQDIIYSYLARDFMTNLSDLLAANPDLQAPTYSEDNFTTFADYFKGSDGDLYGVPMEAFLKVYLYRTDLFNDPAIQAAFKAKTGHDLKPATNHDDYSEIAHFSPPMVRPMIWIFGEQLHRLIPAMLPHGMSIMNRSRRHLGSIIGVSIQITIMPHRWPMGVA